MSVSFKDFLIRSKFNFKKAKAYESYYNQILDKGLFDKKFYLETYPHIAKSGMDPLLHYLFFGYRENKVPNPLFNLEKYLQKYPDIEENPLIHFLNNSEDEFLSDTSFIDLKKNRIINTNSLFLRQSRLKEEPLVSIIILNRNGLNHLMRLFDDFASKTNYSNYEIIVVDNASCDESVEYLYSLKSELPITVIENSQNVSFSKGNNDAAKIARGEYILLLNNDIEPTFGWLNEMVQTMLDNEKAGAVGAKLVFPYYGDITSQGQSFSVQHAGIKFREEITPYIYGPYHENMYVTLLFSDLVNREKEVISNTAACLLVPKDLYLSLGGLDEGYFYGYEDIDFAFKLLEAGYKSIYCPSALLFHHESATRVKDESVHLLNYKNIMYFKSRWEDKLKLAILIDKIYNYNFITNKKLYFTIINDNPSNDGFINEMAKNLNDRGYNIKIVEDTSYINLGEDCDIVISFYKDFNFEDTHSRLNLIKVLISDEDDDSFDIAIPKSSDFTDKLMKNIEDLYV